MTTESPFILSPSKLTKNTKLLLRTEQAAPTPQLVSLHPAAVVFEASQKPPPAQNAEDCKHDTMLFRQASASSPRGKAT